MAVDPTAGLPNGAEREFEIGKDEAWFANMKRTYDEFQQLSLEQMRNLQAMFLKQITDAQQYDNARQNIANQALQNAVETANLVGKQTVRHVENSNETANFVAKQAVRHSDIAIDRQWNVDEQGYTAEDILRGNTFKDAVAAAVAEAVNAVVPAAVTAAVSAVQPTVPAK